MPGAAQAAGEGALGIIDLWRMANAGSAAVEQALVLGVTRGEAVRNLLGFDPNDAAEFDRGDGFICIQQGATFIELAPEGCLSAVGFGDYHDGRTVNATVKTAVAGLDDYGDKTGDIDLRLGTKGLVLRYDGHRVREFATLPRFIAINKAVQGFDVSSWPQDKTVTLIRRTTHGVLHAQFALTVFKTEYTEHFQVDYCLSWLAVFSAASQATRSKS